MYLTTLYILLSCLRAFYSHEDVLNRNCHLSFVMTCDYPGATATNHNSF